MTRLLFLLICLHAQPSLASRCVDMWGRPIYPNVFHFDPETEEMFAPLYFFREFVNVAHITGDRHNSLPFLREGMQLNDDLLSEMRDKSAVSIGEGFTDLVPFLRRNQVFAVGLDVWYHLAHLAQGPSADDIKEYVKANRGALLSADAVQLPFADESFDFVFSSFLLHHLLYYNDVAGIDDEAPAVQFLKEVGRILKVGARSRILFVEPDDVSDQEDLEEVLKLGFASKNFHIERVRSNFMFKHPQTGEELDIKRMLLKIEKTASLKD